MKKILFFFKEITRLKKIFIINLLLYIYLINIYRINIRNKNIGSLANNLTVCMCSIAKKENLYINEFIEHYKKLGYNHFFIYDNNDKNDERLDDVVYEKYEKDLVSIINFRGRRDGFKGPQMISYYDCYEKNKFKCNWISFFDIDEYLILEPNNLTIQEFLDDLRYQDCETIVFNWKIFTDNNLLEYENKPLTERFKEKKEHELNRYIKIISRGNLTLNRSYISHNIWEKAKFCNSFGKPNSSNYPQLYKHGYINHYTTKTVREYCQKLKKGDVYWNKKPINITKRFNIFFSINKKTKEKVKIFNEEFNTSFQ